MHVFAPFNNSFLPFCDNNITDSFLIIHFLPKTLKKNRSKNQNGQKIYGQKVLNILPFQYFGSVFLRCFDNSVRTFSLFLFRIEWSEMGLYCYHRKMVKMKYWKVQIHVLTDFNHNLKLIHYLSHNFQRCLGKLKGKSINRALKWKQFYTKQDSKW